MFVTIRLADSLPRAVIDKLREQQAAASVDQPERFSERAEALLDSSVGECLLMGRGVPEIIEAALQHFSGVRYELFAWVIMPNHAHILLRTNQVTALEKIMGSFKGFTARRINEHLGRSGTLWAREYFDRYIRNERHFEDVVRYIENNPVRAGLCKRAEEWPFSSAARRLKPKAP